MIYPIGEYRCKLDAKGRLLLPRGFKDQLGTALEEGFVLRTGLYEPCLDMFGMDDWRKLQERLGKMNSFRKETLIIQRRINAGARMVKIDGSGRIQIPKDLLDKCGMIKDVVITSLTDRMQIWGEEQLEKSNAEISEEGFMNMLENNLGGDDFNV